MVSHFFLKYADVKLSITIMMQKGKDILLPGQRWNTTRRCSKSLLWGVNMEKLTAWEFEEHCKRRNYTRFCLTSEDQKWNKVECPLKLRLQFAKIRISHNPNRVYLKDGESQVCLQRIKHVLVDSEKIPVGDMLHIICGSWGDSKNDTVYTVMAI